MLLAGRGVGQTDSERMWKNWSQRGFLSRDDRLHEVRLPGFSPRMIDSYLDSTLNWGVAKAAGHAVNYLDVARWQKAISKVEERFSFLITLLLDK